MVFIFSVTPFISDSFLSSDILEQIDISKGLIDRFSNVRFDFTSVHWFLKSTLQFQPRPEAKEAMQSGKIALLSPAVTNWAIRSPSFGNITPLGFGI